MPFPIRHKLITAVGDSFGGREQWSFSLRVLPPINTLGVSQAQADALKPAFQAFFTTGSPALFSTTNRLLAVKLAPIGQDGKYPAGEISYEGVYASPVIGSTSAGTNQWPAQCCMVVTLNTAVPRGRGARGRIYVPSIVQSVDPTTGQIPAQNAGLLAATRTLINAINAVPDVGTVAVLSNLGTVGTSRVVESLSCGRVPDTQRRRRRSLDEAPATVAL